MLSPMSMPGMNMPRQQQVLPLLQRNLVTMACRVSSHRLVACSGCLAISPCHLCLTTVDSLFAAHGLSVCCVSQISQMPTRDLHQAEQKKSGQDRMETGVLMS